MLQGLIRRLAGKSALERAILSRSFVSLVANSSPALPLKREEPTDFLKHEWAYQPFGTSPSSLLLPVYKLQTGKFSGENVDLNKSIFNCPIRRDIVHNVFRYERHAKFVRTKRTKTKGDVAGSGKKPRPQKHTGRARQGDKRAPINKKGGKAFGSVPKDFYFPINKKVRLLAMKSLLSARLAENKIVILDSEKMEEYKTKLIASRLKPFGDSTICLLTHKGKDPLFQKVTDNLERVTVMNSMSAGVKPILKSDFLIFTLTGLEEMEKVLLSRESNYFRNKKVTRDPLPYDDILQKKEKKTLFDMVKKEVSIDPSKKVQINSLSLKTYIQDLKKYNATQIEKKEALLLSEKELQDSQNQNDDEEDDGEDGEEEEDAESDADADVGEEEESNDNSNHENKHKNHENKKNKKK